MRYENANYRGLSSQIKKLRRKIILKKNLQDATVFNSLNFLHFELKRDFNLLMMLKSLHHFQVQCDYGKCMNIATVHISVFVC